MKTRDASHETRDLQGSLEELGGNTLQRLKRRSQSVQGTSSSEPANDAADQMPSSNASPLLRNSFSKFLVAPVEVAVDALNMDHRCRSSKFLYIRENSKRMSSFSHCQTTFSVTMKRVE